MSKDELEKRYDQLLAALSEFQIKAHKPPQLEVPFREGPAFVEYAVGLGYGVSVNRIVNALKDLKLRLCLPTDAEIGWRTHLGNVLLTVPKHDEDRYFIKTSELWARWRRPKAGFRIPIGEDIKGDIVEIQPSSPNSPHFLVAGATGGGKSVALLTILHGATRFYSPDELKLRMIDPKRTELVELESVPHNDRDIGWSAEDAVALLTDAADEMDRRYELFQKARVKDIDEYCEKVGAMPRWLLVLDEYADLTTDDTLRKEIEKQLQRLSQKARAAGMHLIISTQKPVVKVLNTVVKGNLPGRIALRVSSLAESRVILDDGGAEQLVGKGDSLIKVGNAMTRVQFAVHDG